MFYVFFCSYLGFRQLDMPVVDVGLPTGFRVVQSDLDKVWGLIFLGRITIFLKEFALFVDSHI